MIKILANDGIHPAGQTQLEKEGFKVDTTKIAQEKLATSLNLYDAVIVRSATKIRKDLIDACPNLKLIARAGVGLDNIDVDYARSKNIRVINTPAASSQAVAELAFMHMLNLARFGYKSNRDMPSKGDTEFKALKKSYSKGTQLRGKTLGLIGFGRIGQETARIGLGMGMKVLPVDLQIDAADITVDVAGTDGVTVRLNTVAWEEMIANSDFISLHVPFMGKALISTKDIEMMKDGVFIVNCSRGGTVDEDALLAGLESGKVAGAGLDVFENEPTPKKALLEHERISLSPHIGASTVEAQANIGLELASKIYDHFIES